MEKSEEKRETENALSEIIEKTAAQQIEIYLLGFRNGLSAAMADDSKDKKEPA